MINLKQVLKATPDCLKSRATFKNTLLAAYPNERRMVNVLATIYESGVVDQIRTSSYLTYKEVDQLASYVEQEYGINTQYIDEGLQIWIRALDMRIGSGSLLELACPAPRVTVDILFLIDCSATTIGNCIGTINASMEELIYDEIYEIKERWDDHLLRLRIMEITSNPIWKTDKAEPFDDYQWDDLQAGGDCNLPKALALLNEHFILQYHNPDKPKAPLIVLFLASEIQVDYQEELMKLRKSAWFRSATKIGFKIGDQCPEKVLADFCGSPEAIISISEKQLFPRLISGHLEYLYDDTYHDVDEYNMID